MPVSYTITFYYLLIASDEADDRVRFHRSLPFYYLLIASSVPRRARDLDACEAFYYLLIASYVLRRCIGAARRCSFLLSLDCFASRALPAEAAEAFPLSTIS